MLVHNKLGDSGNQAGPPRASRNAAGQQSANPPCPTGTPEPLGAIPNAQGKGGNGGGNAPSKYKGGRHGETKGPTGDGLESHHMPADSVNGLPRDKGPAIQMDPLDHAKTASNGKMPGSNVFRAKQQQLIKQGRFGEAIQMDIDDIRSKFGNKYDEAIKQMIDSLDPSMKVGLKG